MTKPIPSEFVALRARAKARRDQIIKDANHEYESNLVEIATIERNLLGKRPEKNQNVSSCINQVLPKDEPFTVNDIMRRLESLDSGRYWRLRTVNAHISALRERGIVKRLSRPGGAAPACYACSGYDFDVSPIANMSLCDVIRSVLTNPMTTLEVAVAVREAGYKTTMTDKRFLKHVVRELGREFEQAGGKWIAKSDAGHCLAPPV